MGCGSFRYDYLNLFTSQSDNDLGLLVNPARQARADIYRIGEHLPEEPPRTNKRELSGCWHQRFMLAMRTLVREDEADGYSFHRINQAAEVLDYDKQGYRNRSQMMNCLESHDDTRLATVLNDAGFDPDFARRPDVDCARVADAAA